MACWNVGWSMSISPSVLLLGAGCYFYRAPHICGLWVGSCWCCGGVQLPCSNQTRLWSAGVGRTDCCSFLFCPLIGVTASIVAAGVVCIIVAAGRYSGIVVLVTVASHAPYVSNGLLTLESDPTLEVQHCIRLVWALYDSTLSWWCNAGHTLLFGLNVETWSGRFAVCISARFEVTVVLMKNHVSWDLACRCVTGSWFSCTD
jgi:hypothetical protein